MSHPSQPEKKAISRRAFIKYGAITSGVGLLAAGAPLVIQTSGEPGGPSHAGHHHASPPVPEPHEGMGHGDYSGTVGDVDLAQFDPSQFMTTFNWGKETPNADGSDPSRI